MGGSDENNSGALRPANFQGGLRMGVTKFVTEVGHNRRALSNINRNLVGVPPYPCAVNKRCLSGKNALCEKNPSLPVHRPITRKFAAQMASKQQTGPQGTKRQVGSVSNSNGSEDSLLIDVEDYKAVSNSNGSEDSLMIDVEDYKAVSNSNGSEDSLMIDVEDYKAAQELPVPIFDQIKEVEMEDIVVDPIVDIDSCDANNPLAVVEYIDDIYGYYRKMEISGCIPLNYMTQQIDINEKMRAILIDWLIKEHYKFELMDETLYLTVNLIDRFLSCQTVMRKKLQLVGVTAMLLACKYEEVSVAVVKKLLISYKAYYTTKEVLDMERLMVNTLQFNMSVPTPYVFMRRFLKAAQSDKKVRGKIGDFIKGVFAVFQDLDFSFLEMNPFTLVNGEPYPLDMRGELDDTAAFKNFKKWGSIEFPLPFGRVLSPTESFIHSLDEKTSASLKFTVLNPKGRIWTMVAGGGASVIYADIVGDLGYASELGNYAEYSGAPNEEEVLQYARVVIDCATADPDGRKRALLIGGGIANFTDVATTFNGIIRALREKDSKLKASRMHIYVRRGGPNYQTGLAKMRALGDELGIPIEVYGPEATMTGICKQAIDCVMANA